MPPTDMLFLEQQRLYFFSIPVKFSCIQSFCEMHKICFETYDVGRTVVVQYATRTGRVL